MKNPPQSVAPSGPLKFKRSEHFIHYDALRPPYWLWYGYVVAIALYGVLFTFCQTEPVPFSVHIMGVSLAAACFFPLALWISRGRRGLPMFELICMAYLLALGLPLYLQTNSLIIMSTHVQFSWDQTFEALWIANLGVVAMIAGYMATVNMPRLRLLPKLDLPLDSSRFRIYAKVSVFAGSFIISLDALNIPLLGGGAAGILRLLFSQIYLSIILLAYRIFQKTAASEEKLLFWFAVFVAGSHGLASGMVEVAMIPLVLIILVRWHVTQRLPFGALFICLCLFFLLSSTKDDFRRISWYNAEKISFSERISLWVGLGQSAAEDSVTGTTSHEDAIGASSDSTWRRSLQRFDLLHQFIYIRDLTPYSVPFFGGSTYTYLFYGWIPRFIWPDKPVASTAQDDLAIAYRFMPEEDKGKYSIGTGFLPEAYANFGSWGVPCVMVVQGVFLAFVNMLLNGPNSQGGRAIYLSVMIYFINGIGAGTALTFSAILPGIVGSALLLRPCAKGWSALSNRMRVGHV
jgi:hypothetical protein